MFEKNAEVVCATEDILGESPAWSSGRDVLYWVDIRRGILHEFSPSSGVYARHDLGPALLAGVVPAKDGRLLLGRARGLELCSGADPKHTEQIAGLDFMPPQNRVNEMKADPAGRLWFGSMWDFGQGCSGALYRLEAGGGPALIRDNVTIPNSLAFSPDGKWIYFADTKLEAVEGAPYDPGTGEVGKWRMLIPPQAAPGRPDGVAVDSEGCLWSARFAGSGVTRFSPDGRVLGQIRLPSSQPTSCCFGGSRLDTLYITTARQKLSPGQLKLEPLAGALFAVVPGVTGLPAAEAAL